MKEAQPKFVGFSGNLMVFSDSPLLTGGTVKEAQPTRTERLEKLAKWQGPVYQEEAYNMAEEILRLRAELEQVRQERDEANRIKDAFRQKWEEITRNLNRLGDERSEERRKSTWEYIRRHYGKVEDWARKELPEPWKHQFFCCLANGTSGVASSDYFKDSAAEQLFYDQCNRAEASESREKKLKEALEKMRREMQLHEVTLSAAYTYLQGQPEPLPQQLSNSVAEAIEACEKSYEIIERALKGE